MYLLCLKLNILYLYKYIWCPTLNYLFYILACNIKGKYAKIELNIKSIICVLFTIVIFNVVFCFFSLFLVVIFFYFFSDFFVKIFGLNLDLILYINPNTSSPSISNNTSSTATNVATTSSITLEGSTATSSTSSGLYENKPLNNNDKYEVIQLQSSSRQGTHPVDYSHIGMNRTYEYLDSGRRLQSMRELEKEYIEKYEQANRDLNKSPTAENAANMNFFSMALEELRSKKKQLKINHNIPMGSDSEGDSGEDI